MKPSFSFSKIKQNDLVYYFNLAEKVDPQQFQDWFNFDYNSSKEEHYFLQTLVRRYGKYLKFYNEMQLKALFIIPLLNKVDFESENKGIRNWYEAALTYEFEHINLSGVTDYMVATGEFAPKMPCFFIQEFKQALPSQHPLTQLVAELIVATAVNQTNKIRGAYIIGESWKFIILEKTANNQYHYYTSRGFDSSVEEDLTQIYINLQAVKHKYCTILLND